jgi:hypothetical protein
MHRRTAQVPGTVKAGQAAGPSAAVNNPTMSQALLREMFDRMVVAKDAALVPVYYHPDLLLTTNGQLQDYEAFASGHQKVYGTAISYAVTYDDEAWVESPDRVAGRMWITTQRPDEPPTRIEVVFIATFLGGQIHRLWELTWPDWSKLGAFENYG